MCRHSSAREPLVDVRAANHYEDVERLEQIGREGEQNAPPRMTSGTYDMGPCCLRVISLPIVSRRLVALARKERLAQYII